MGKDHNMYKYLGCVGSIRQFLYLKSKICEVSVMVLTSFQTCLLKFRCGFATTLSYLSQ